MAKVKDIIDRLEKHAPLETQENWDNSGWQVNLGIKSAKNVMLTLNVTEDTVAQAVKNNCELIISHHPMIFSPLKNIKNKAIITAIQNNIQIYSAHTNFDKAPNGTTAVLVQKLEKPLNLTKIKDVNEYVKSAKLKTPMGTDEFTQKIRSALNLKSIKIANPAAEIKSAAFCAGAGAEFLLELQNNVDCFVTADIKYHQALDSKIMLADIGHYESEVIALESLKKIIEMPDLNIIFSKEEPVFEIV